ncbi:hypothetical protein BKA81DRAFT_348234 [Phyllosticta paracitricarpa]
MSHWRKEGHAFLFLSLSLWVSLMRRFGGRSLVFVSLDAPAETREATDPTASWQQQGTTKKKAFILKLFDKRTRPRLGEIAQPPVSVADRPTDSFGAASQPGTTDLEPP